jgi:hypothetical protein
LIDANNEDNYFYVEENESEAAEDSDVDVDDLNEKIFLSFKQNEEIRKSKRGWKQSEKFLHWMEALGSLEQEDIGDFKFEKKKRKRNS